MSQQEIVDAYVNGQMSRRLFIRRLVGSGVALGAAVSYAHLLTPEVKAKGVTAFGYDPPTLSGLQMVPGDLDRIIKKKRLKMRATSSQPASWPGIRIFLFRSPEKTEWPEGILAETTLEFDSAGTQVFEVDIGFTYDNGRNCALDALKAQKRKAKIGFNSSNAIVYRR